MTTIQNNIDDTCDVDDNNINEANGAIFKFNATRLSGTDSNKFHLVVKGSISNNSSILKAGDAVELETCHSEMKILNDMGACIGIVNKQEELAIRQIKHAELGKGSIHKVEGNSLTLHMEVSGFETSAKDMKEWFEKKGMQLISSPTTPTKSSTSLPLKTPPTIARLPLPRELNIDAMIEELADDNIHNFTCTSEFVKNLPDTLMSTLKTHQLQGVYWMLTKEQTSEHVLPPLWTRRCKSNSYYCSVGDIHQQERPHPVLGGLVADEMGLGKTLQVIALILMNADHSKRSKVQGASSLPPTSHRRPTLIVCPPSVIQHWEDQLSKHVKPNTLNVHIYHGNVKKADPEFLSSQDVVITTHTVLRSEWNMTEEGRQERDSRANKRDEDSRKRKSKFDNPNGGAMFRVEWLRVVLDEAHDMTLGSLAAKCDKACNSLDSKYRWALTTTPLLNKAADNVFSLLSFLKMEPVDDRSVFLEIISKNALKLVLKNVLLRRRKSVLAQLVPNPDVFTVKLDGIESCSCYQSLLNAAKTMANSLDVITQLRLCACHHSLVEGSVPCDRNKESAAYSPKSQALLDELLLTPPDEKSVVFSCFTSFLDMIGDMLDRNGIKFAILTDDTSGGQKYQQLQAFSNDPKVNVLLCSLGAEVKLKLATRVYIMDPCWDMAIEQQSLDRVHIIGQKQIVTRFVMKNTVEEDMVEMQVDRNALEKLSPEEMAERMREMLE